MDDPTGSIVLDELAQVNLPLDVGLLIQEYVTDWPGITYQQMVDGRKQDVGSLKLLDIPIQKVLDMDAHVLNMDLHLVGITEIVRINANLGGGEICALLDGLSGLKQLLVLKCFAAGRSLTSIGTFLDRARALEGPDLLDAVVLSSTPNKKIGLLQQHSDYCACATVQIFLSRFDPIYALELTVSNKDLSQKLGKAKKSLFSLSFFSSGIDDNEHAFLDQKRLSDTFSHDTSGRRGLSPADRMDAFNALVAITGYQYCMVDVTAEVLTPDGRPTGLPGEEDPGRYVLVATLIRYALTQGLPVGVGVGGHAAIFIDVDATGVWCYEPSYGQSRHTKYSSLDKGFVSGPAGSDTVMNVLLPVFNDGPYIEAIRSLGLARIRFP